jgi:hypothetical protein
MMVTALSINKSATALPATSSGAPSGHGQVSRARRLV